MKMNRVRNVLAVATIALAALAFAPDVSAQNVTYDLQSTSLNGGTANQAGASTNSTYNVQITVTKATHLGVQPVFRLDGSGTSAVVCKFDESLDGSNWSASAFSVSVTANGTNVVTGVGDFAVNSRGYIRLRTIENPNAGNITNLVLRAAAKKGL